MNDMENDFLRFLYKSKRTFAASENAMEDAFGVIIAAVLGQYWGQYFGSYWSPGDGTGQVLLTTGTAMITGQRVGPGEWWAAVFVLPLLYTVGLLVRYQARTVRRIRGNGHAP